MAFIPSRGGQIVLWRLLSQWPSEWLRWRSNVSGSGHHGHFGATVERINTKADVCVEMLASQRLLIWPAGVIRGDSGWVRT